MKNPKPQQTRWLSYISEFNFEFQHVSGSDNVVADALLRSLAAITSDLSETMAKEQHDDAHLQTFF